MTITTTTTLPPLSLPPIVTLAALALAAGGHSAILIGPPGVGLTMLARRVGQWLPDLSPEQSAIVTRIWGYSRMPDTIDPIVRPPVRMPHHTVSLAGLLGGRVGWLGCPSLRRVDNQGLRQGVIGPAAPPRIVPGEVSLAHGGLLFLDSIAEFQPLSLRAMFAVLQAGHVDHRRMGEGDAVRFPAAPSVLATSHPCPCGYLGGSLGAIERACVCTHAAISRWYDRVALALPSFAIVLDVCGTIGPMAPDVDVPAASDYPAAVAEARAAILAGRVPCTLAGTLAALGCRDPRRVAAYLAGDETRRRWRLAGLPGVSVGGVTP